MPKSSVSPVASNTAVPPVKRKPGRPAGSKNKKPSAKAVAAVASAAPAAAVTKSNKISKVGKSTKATKATKATRAAKASKSAHAAPVVVSTNDVVEFRRLALRIGLPRAAELLTAVRRQLDALIAGH